MIRLGLCCLFVNEPIRFRTATARGIRKLERAAALERLGALCLANGEALLAALEYCAGHGIGDFRVNSQILPLRTHPDVGYRVAELPAAGQITALYKQCGRFAQEHRLRLTFHPDAFILLSSPRPEVTRSSIEELDYQAQVAEWIGADVINIHAGGGYGDKRAALARLGKTLERLPDRVRRRLTFENDERLYAPRDLLPLCRAVEVPLVYDVHHHRCLPDGYSVGRATDLAMATWNREPLVHVSSPRNGWRGAHPEWHHNYIAPRDVPREWLGRILTVEVEAKAKEMAVARLARYLAKQRHTQTAGR